MTPEIEEQYQKVESHALGILLRAFEPETTDDVVKQVKEALAIIAKKRQTLSVRNAIRQDLKRGERTTTELNAKRGVMRRIAKTRSEPN